jgi:mono/diheme cytochrome c family protein
MNETYSNGRKKMLNKYHWSEFALWGVALTALVLAAAPTFAQGATKDATAKHADAVSVERGKYLAKTAGCNDCHTAGYMANAGKVPQSEWLKGDTLGWNGPWGTTYAPNLRILMSKLTEEQWVHFAKTAQLRPPMPWFGLRDMTEADHRSLYRFVKSLGAPGEPAPAYLPPGVAPRGSFVQFPAPPQ